MPTKREIYYLEFILFNNLILLFFHYTSNLYLQVFLDLLRFLLILLISTYKIECYFTGIELYDISIVLFYVYSNVLLILYLWILFYTKDKFHEVPLILYAFTLIFAGVNVSCMLMFDWDFTLFMILLLFNFILSILLSTYIFCLSNFK